MADGLDGSVALITGAGRGQGRSHAIALANEGVDIVAVDIQGGDLPWLSYPNASKDDMVETVRLVEATGRRVLARQADVRDLSAMKAIADEAVSEFGRLDIVCANAGIVGRGSPIWEIPEEEWDDVIGINATGAWKTLVATIPHMIASGNGGSVVITASTAGIGGVRNLAHYAASKHAVIGLMRTAAQELARHDIRVNAICPSSVNTIMIQNEAMHRLFRPDLENPTIDDVKPVFASLNLLDTPWLEPEDISHAVVFLCSDRGRFITGREFVIDAGMLAAPRGGSR